jgi:cytochrome c553
LNRRVVVVLEVMIVLAVLLVVFTVTHQRPMVPRDAVHLQSDETTSCLSCHGRGRPNARPRNHPPLNDRCWECHEQAS